VIDKRRRRRRWWWWRRRRSRSKGRRGGKGTDNILGLYPTPITCQGIRTEDANNPIP